MGFGKTHKYYKKYLYSLWVWVKPINYTKNIYIVYGFYRFTQTFKLYSYFLYPLIQKIEKIFIYLMGFAKTIKRYKNVVIGFTKNYHVFYLLWHPVLYKSY